MRFDQYRRKVHSTQCIYCGQPSRGGLDHWPPRSVANVGWLLPCCIECNHIAGTHWPYDFLRRAEMVKKELERRYGWDSEKGNARGEKLKSRLVWNVEENLSRIVPISDFAPVYADSVTIVSPLHSRRSDLGERYILDLIESGGNMRAFNKVVAKFGMKYVMDHLKKRAKEDGTLNNIL